MSSTAQNYFNALLALSGDTASADARNGLLANIRNEDLADVITHGLTMVIPRVGLEEVAAKLLDVLAREGKPTTATAGYDGTGSRPQSQEHTQETSGGHEHGGIAQSRASSQNKSPMKATAREQSSSSSNKRLFPPADRRSPRKRRRSGSTDPEDNEVPIKLQLSSEDEGIVDHRENRRQRRHRLRKETAASKDTVSK